MDSYDKAIAQYWGNLNKGFFIRINPTDIDCVKEAIFRAFPDIDNEYEYNDNHRVYHISQRKKFDQTQTCCGHCEISIKCKSGRVYLYGFNYGH